MTAPTPAQEVEAFVESLFGNIATTSGATSTRQVSKHLVIAASGSFAWTTGVDCWLRAVKSDTAQNAVTVNGLTYTNIVALTAPSQLFAGVLVYSNAAVTDNINAFIPAGSKITVSVSSSGTQRLTLYFDEAI